MRLSRKGSAPDGPPAGGSGAASPSPATDDRAAGRAAFAQEQGWTFAASDQRALLGWPRTALPPGPLGRVHNAVSGFHGGRPFTIFDYVTGTAPPLAVYSVGLPRRLPYLYVQDHDALRAEARDRDYAVALLADPVVGQAREHALTDLIVDGDRIITTGADGSPSALVARLHALTELVSLIPDEVWSEWGENP